MPHNQTKPNSAEDVLLVEPRPGCMIYVTWNIWMRMYFLKAWNLHLPIRCNSLSETTIIEAIVAAPILKLCSLYVLGESPYQINDIFKFSVKKDLVTGYPHGKTNRDPGDEPCDNKYVCIKACIFTMGDYQGYWMALIMLIRMRHYLWLTLTWSTCNTTYDLRAELTTISHIRKKAHFNRI